MSYRYMRVIVFFDLPTVSGEGKSEYRRFRKFLIKKGFLMVQESVYSKIALNQTAALNIEKSVRENRPRAGLVQMLTVTEKQYAKMEYVVGEKQTTIIDSDDRLVVI